MANEPQGETEPTQELPDQESQVEVQEETPSATPTDNEAQDDEATALEESKNPERTRAYIERLKAERDEARSKLSEPTPSVFDTFSPQVNQVTDATQYTNLNQNQVDDIASQFFDKDGNVDVDGLTRTLRQADQTAKAMAQRLQYLEQQVATQERSRQESETYAKHPELNPKSDKFDRQFYELVRDRLVGQYASNQSPNFLKAAEDIRKIYKREVSEGKIKEQAVSEYKQSQAEKVQGPIEKGRGKERQATVLSELRERSRKGGDEAARAIAARLAALEESE